MTFPWEKVPAVAEQPQLPAERTTEETVALLQKDLAYVVKYTAVLVHSNRPALEMLVNTPRGQIIPRGACEFTDGTTVEFQDIGAPQPGAPTMSVKDLVARVWEIASELGLEVPK